MAIIGVNRVHCKASDCNKLPFYGHGIMTCRFTPSGRNHLLRPAFTVAPVPSFAHSLVRDLGPNGTRCPIFLSPCFWKCVLANSVLAVKVLVTSPLYSASHGLHPRLKLQSCGTNSVKHSLWDMVNKPSDRWRVTHDRCILRMSTYLYSVKKNWPLSFHPGQG
jgi:hypothetical protein